LKRCTITVRNQKYASKQLILNEFMVRKGGFEKPFQRILNDLQGLGRSV